jgi:hypothetical protein
MTIERLPTERLPDESSVPTPRLSPQFREQVFARVRRVRRRRHTQRLVALVALFLVAFLGVTSARRWSFPFRARSLPVAEATAHWSRALDDDLNWLEAAGGSSLDEDSTNWADLTGVRGDPTVYLFPAFQTLQVTERQLVLR